MLAWFRTSTGMAMPSPSKASISRTTVLMVEAGELGSGGKGWQVEASEVVLAETTTEHYVS